MGPDEFKYGQTLGRLGCYAHNIALFGETYKSAREQQRAARKAHGYTGRDMYTGIPAEAGITVRH